MPSLPQATGSPSDQILLDHLERHVEGEDEMLTSYTGLALSAPEHVRYLISLIVDDEERHHRILAEMANRVRGDMTFEDTGPSIPYVRFGGVDKADLLETTNRFLDLERDDLKGLKELDKVMKRQRLRGLLPLLVQMMELDTKKHIAILEFIADTTRHPAG